MNAYGLLPFGQGYSKKNKHFSSLLPLLWRQRESESERYNILENNLSSAFSRRSSLVTFFVSSPFSGTNTWPVCSIQHERGKKDVRKQKFCKIIVSSFPGVFIDLSGWSLLWPCLIVLPDLFALPILPLGLLSLFFAVVLLPPLQGSLSLSPCLIFGGGYLFHARSCTTFVRSV